MMVKVLLYAWGGLNITFMNPPRILNAKFIVFILRLPPWCYRQGSGGGAWTKRLPEPAQGAAAIS
jgi:hypothetical protein